MLDDRKEAVDSVDGGEAVGGVAGEGGGGGEEEVGGDGMEVGREGGE